MRLSQIQGQIGRGEYRVDTQAVADAIIRRLIVRPPVGARGTPPTSERVLVTAQDRRRSVDPQLGPAGIDPSDHRHGDRRSGRR